MLNSLIEFLKTQLNHIIPIGAVYEFQLGIRMRFGRVNKILVPGWWFKIPYIDVIMVEQSVDTTMLLPAQAIVTKDNKQLIVKGSVGYKIVDIEKFYCNVWDTRSAISDRACVIIKDTLSSLTFEMCKDSSIIDSRMLEELQLLVVDYGIEIHFVSLVSITESRSFMLFNESNILNNQL